MSSNRVVIIGAGIGGLSAALVLSGQGCRVDVLERASAAGGKMRQMPVHGRMLDAGPTVFTMRWIFEELFATAGANFGDYVSAKPMQLLARHAWHPEAVLDLHTDVQRSAEAIGDFAGAGEARGFLAFSKRARQIYTSLDLPFMRQAGPSLPGLVAHHLARGWPGMQDLLGITPFTTMWRALEGHFRDPRLRQLFGRYATYCGSSPFLAPATLMLIAHVEQRGVWDVEGGMGAIAGALERLAVARGVHIHYGAAASEIIVAKQQAQGVKFITEGHEQALPADYVFCNGDSNALASGWFGANAQAAVTSTPVEKRSLSALTWSMVARTRGFPLHRHNVFFARDYAREFDDLFKYRRLPGAPTVYVCAQDRDDRCATDNASERLLVLVNAPATGDFHEFSHAEVETCQQSTKSLLSHCGLQIDWESAATIETTPNDWNRMFPATGGALYGRATHGWRASFQRPGVRSRIRNLYLTGGSGHPGPGVAMACLSGQLAAKACMADHLSTFPSHPAVMHGGTSMR